MAPVAALLLAVAFGAGDQYLGSFSAHPWAADVSLLSAPWLVLAFVVGWLERDPKRAAVLGLACTFAALVGYGLMTLSPLENAHLTPRGIAGFVQSESRVFVGAFVTGPLFGWLGNRWRSERFWAGALAAAGAVSLEPLARLVVGGQYEIRFRTVSLAEAAVGLAMLAYVAHEVFAGRSRLRRTV
jgi:hypothetical protein